LQLWAHIWQPDKSSPVFGDGIRGSSDAYANPNCRSSEKIMTYDWTLLQTLLFIITPYFLMLALAKSDEDDGPPDGGLMTPVYAPTP